MLHIPEGVLQILREGDPSSCEERPSGFFQPDPSASPPTPLPEHFTRVSLGWVPREQKRLKGHLPRVTYHQAY